MTKALLTILLSLSFIITKAQQEYSVKQGETVQSVAEKFGLSIEELQQLNPGVDMWFTGLVLNVPQKKKTETIPPPESAIELSSIKLDKIILRDGSYVLCKLLQANRSFVTFTQNGEDGKFSIAIKDIKEINYADGSKKKYAK